MNKLLLSLLLAATLGVARAQTPAPADAPATASAAELVRDGIGLYDAGRYTEALAKYQQALDLAPTSPLARAELAMAYNALDRNDEAAALCQQLVQENPRVSPFVYAVYGRSLADSRPAEALAAYRQGIQYFPTDANLHLNEGIALAGQRDYEGAAASFRYAVALQPDQASAHMLLGITQLQLGARVPGLLAMARFLVLEPTGPRSQQRQQWLDQVMLQGVAAQPSGNHVQLSVPASGLRADGGRVGDDFGPEEVLLAMQGAFSLSDASQHKTKLEKFIDQFGALCRALGERQPQAGRGFARTYYAPYFAEMERRGFVPAFAYLTHSAQPNAPEVRQWLAAHPLQVRGFQEWSRSYPWPKLKQPKP
ncbi:tetratricopeptide repeat protein [Hymenobacter sp. RP-2-7]|uniref:Tetratricopeptide repeat protein n=1 Tax=Hymenobacter polaris TaxID=2682546 RepID=A0A7Y0AAV2_9BACT|nr:tetratricopeptide repeat protein [Hymenobacter polaris]NML63797.1 tetratricopeptide repeat protein [Hymenobacter polaris]